MNTPANDMHSNPPRGIPPLQMSDSDRREMAKNHKPDCICVWCEKWRTEFEGLDTKHALRWKDLNTVTEERDALKEKLGEWLQTCFCKGKAKCLFCETRDLIGQQDPKDIEAERDWLKGDVEKITGERDVASVNAAGWEREHGKRLEELAALKAAHEEVKSDYNRTKSLLDHERLIAANKAKREASTGAAPPEWPTMEEQFQAFNKARKEFDVYRYALKAVERLFTARHKAIVAELESVIAAKDREAAAIERLNKITYDEQSAAIKKGCISDHEQRGTITDLRSQADLLTSECEARRKQMNELRPVLENVQEILYWLSVFRSADGYRVAHQIRLYNDIVRIANVARPSSWVDSQAMT